MNLEEKSEFWSETLKIQTSLEWKLRQKSLMDVHLKNVILARQLLKSVILLTVNLQIAT